MTVPTGARLADSGIELDLPKPPGGFRLWLERHPRLVDAAVMLSYSFPQLVLTVAVAVSAAGGQEVPLLIGAAAEAVLFVATTVLLMLRRRRPVALFVVATIGLLPAALGTDIPLFFFAPWAVMIAIYTLATVRGSRQAVIAFAVAAALSGAGTVVLMLPGPGVLAGGFSAIFMALLYASALLAGTTVGGRRRYVAALVERAEQLARERDQQARIATQAERSRIAGEMHDIIAHSLSVIVRLADGAEAVIEQDPAAAKNAIHLVSDTGRSSLAEMRRLLGVLRDDETDAGAGAGAMGGGTAARGVGAPAVGAPAGAGRARGAGGSRGELEPQPRLEQLPTLLERYRAAGLPVRLEQRGVMPSSVGVQLAIYRAVQEGLTNALRYARSPGHVTARIVAHEAGAVEVEVVDDGLAGPPAASVGMGRGIIGMRQRAALYGGSVESGPLPGRGWRVRMTLPQAGDDATADAGERGAASTGSTGGAPDPAVAPASASGSPSAAAPATSTPAPTPATRAATPPPPPHGPAARPAPPAPPSPVSASTPSTRPAAPVRPNPRGDRS